MAWCNCGDTMGPDGPEGAPEQYAGGESGKREPLAAAQDRRRVRLATPTVTLALPVRLIGVDVLTRSPWQVPMQMSRRNGFSMIELLCTLVIMAIIMGVAVPRMDLSRMRGDAALRQLTMLCIQAQRTALTKQHNVILSVDQSNARVRLIEDRNNSGAFDAGDRMVWMTLESGVQFIAAPAPLDGISGTVSFVKPKLIDSYQSVIFRRNGAASSDGLIVVSAKSSDARAARALFITQSTGRADGYNYSGAAWIRAGI